MKKVIAIIVIIFIIFLAFFLALRFEGAKHLESNLLTCNAYPMHCQQTINIDQINLEQFESPQITQRLFHYLTQEAGFQDIKWAQFQVSSDDGYIAVIKSGFVVENSLAGMEPLICSQDSCTIFENKDTIILANGYPIIHTWEVKRENTSIGLNGIFISGVETQKLAIIPFEPGETFAEGMRAVSDPPFEEYEIMLERILNDEDSLLWHKHLHYEITCSLFGCTKRYEAIK